MGKKEKLVRRLKEKPKDFTFEEAETLLGCFAYRPCQKGKTSGSRVRFRKGSLIINMHKPHPRKELLDYQIRDLIDVLKEGDLI